jgi:hypothetical protein
MFIARHRLTPERFIRRLIPVYLGFGSIAKMIETKPPFKPYLVTDS